MPQTRLIADALSVVTICLVAVLILFGLFCITYTLYFRNGIRSQGLDRFNYFGGPWIIKIAYIFVVVWCGVGEIIRLSILRRNGKILDALEFKWHENVCKSYIVLNLGFAEPCLFLTLIFLLRASVQRLGPLTRNWSVKTAGFIILYCLPMFILQLVVIIIGPKYEDKLIPKIPSYFIKTAISSDDVAVCAYPLLSTTFLGVFAIILTGYLFWLGRRILNLVINKGLQKRVYTLIFFISSFFPSRVILLGLSALSTPENAVFDVIVFLAFISLMCCAGVGICILVYLPVADSLALTSRHRDIENTTGDEYNENVSLVANSPVRSSVESENRGSISFRVKESDEGCGEGFVELSLFNSSGRSTSTGSPSVLGWPMNPPQVQGYVT